MSGDGAPSAVERVRAELQLAGAPDDGPVVAAVVGRAVQDLGVGDEEARHLADAAAAVSRAVQARGFDDPHEAQVDVTVIGRGHEVVVRLDDTGLPFSYELDEGGGTADVCDGHVLRDALRAGWVDRVEHRWRGRVGNRTELVRHLPAGDDERDHPPDGVSMAEPAEVPPDVRLAEQLEHTSRLATADDVAGICRLTWRTYGGTYQHDEYYRPRRLAQMIEGGTQVSFVTLVDDELVGHSALVLDEPGAVIVEGGRAMVDPRFRGHHLMGAPAELRGRWFAEHGVLGLAGVAVTAHTRSQRGDSVSNLLLAFLPPLQLRSIQGADTDLREAVVGGVIPMAPIPPADVVTGPTDAEVLATIYDALPFERTLRVGEPRRPSAGACTIEVRVKGDLGHAVLVVREVGTDLELAVRQRLHTIAEAGVGVTYADLPTDDPATPWAVDVLSSTGFVLGGVMPLELDGIDALRYQHLGDTRVDPAAIHLKAQQARDLLAYVLDRRKALS
jgi:serine/threonine-protein kinase RsbW